MMAKPVTPQEREAVVDYLTAKALQQIAWKHAALTPEEARFFGVTDADNAGLTELEIQELQLSFAADPLGVRQEEPH